MTCPMVKVTERPDLRHVFPNFAVDRLKCLCVNQLIIFFCSSETCIVLDHVFRRKLPTVKDSPEPP